MAATTSATITAAVTRSHTAGITRRKIGLWLRTAPATANKYRGCFLIKCHSIYFYFPEQEPNIKFITLHVLNIPTYKITTDYWNQLREIILSSISLFIEIKRK